MRKPFPSLMSVHTFVFDFDGVFTDNKVWVDENGKESVRCDRADGLAFDMVRAFQKQGKLNAEFFILSKEPNPVVLARAKKLRVPCHHGITNKVLFMEEYLSRQRVGLNDPFEGLIYLGNDLNDFPLMSRAGYAVCPQDAHSKIKEIAHLILRNKGGEGCVREFIELFLLRIDLFTKEMLYEFISDC